jgi:hypothetical protein
MDDNRFTRLSFSGMNPVAPIPRIYSNTADWAVPEGGAGSTEADHFLRIASESSRGLQLVSGEDRVPCSVDLLPELEILLVCWNQSLHSSKLTI